MKKYIIIAITAFTLSGCGALTKKEPPVIEYRNAQKSAPAELYDIPPYPKLEFNEETKQSDVAQWIIDIEQYIQNLEGKIKALKEFFEPEVK